MNTLYNLARVTTATTGTGTITLGSTLSGFLTFAQAGVPDGAVVSYGIADGVNSWTGKGTWTLSTNTLTRDQTYRSTGSGNNTNISLSGSAQVFITPAAEDFRGTTTTDDAVAGGIGEYTEAAASGVALTTATQTNITSIALTAGDWEVEGVVEFDAAASTVVAYVSVGVNSVSATLPAGGTIGRTGYVPPNTSGSDVILATGRKRIKSDGTIVAYLVAYSSHTFSTQTAAGHMAARRVR